MSEAIESTAREMTVSDDGAPARPLPARRPGGEVLMPADLGQVVAGMRAYQELLPQLLDASDYQEAGRGRRFVKKSGWRKIARAFNLSVEIVSIDVERDERGIPTRAECVARAVAPSGQHQDGDGYCTVDESRFAEEAGRGKLENDLRATATTRAKNRAIADLVGMGEVSAEEATAADAGPTVERANDDDQAAAKRALGRLVGDPDRAFAIYTEAIQGFGGVAAAPFIGALIAIGEAARGGG